MRAAFAIALILLTGCGSSGAPPAVASRADRSPSWISPLASSGNRLLYVSDLGRWDVYMYTFPGLIVVGKLTGFNNPQGLCSDAAGNVWIANTGADEMLEYAHASISIVASLSDPVGPPIGCAVDPATGDLAVMNVYNFSGAGSVLVYPKARGTPKVYSGADVSSYYFGAYRNGNLFVSGATSNGTYVLATLPHGAGSISPVAVKGGTIYFPGTVAWRSSTLVLGDQQCKKSATSCLYELSVSGKTATVERTVSLGGSCDVAQAWVGATQIAAGNNGEYCGTGRSRVEIWPYPKGGTPAKSVSSPRAPVGATLSSVGGF